MRKKLTMLLASLFLVLGTAWAQTRVLKLTGEQIGTTYPYALTDEDAAKVFGLTDLTIAVKVNTPASLSGRRALFCTSDPGQNTHTDAKGTNSHYVAYGMNETDISYLASCKDGDRFSSNSKPISVSTNDVTLVYILNPSNNTCKLYVNGVQQSSWVNAHSDGFMNGYEIATPKMVKDDYTNAKIYIGGGVKADNSAFETFNGTITGVEVYDGALDAEQVKGVFLGPVVGQRYRLKNEATGLYMQANGTSNLQLQEKNRVTSQYFFIENAADGKYYLKSDIGPNRYVNVSQWNAVVNKNDDKTPYAIELVDGKTGVYALYQTKNTNVDLQGNIGTENNTAGSVLYCNAPGTDHVGWVFEPVTDTPEVCTFDPNKKYRIRSEYSGLYMQLETTGTSGKTEGAFQIKELDEDASSQKFFFESAGNDQYYLKTVKDGTTYYINQGEWNFHAETSATTPFTIALVPGHTAVYSFHQTVGGGYSGYAGNNMEASNGKYARIYCNLETLEYNTVWSFEEVEVAPLPAVGDYIRLQNRAKGGYMKAMDDAMIRRTEDKSDLATLWLVEEGTNGSVKLKNVSAQKYVGSIVESGDVKMVDSSNAAQLTFSNIDDAYCAFQVTGGGNRTFANMDEWNGVFKVVGWQNDDPASQWVSSQAYPLTVVYKIGSVVDSEETVYVDAGESYTIDTKDQPIASCVVDKGEVVVTDGVYTIPAVNGATTVTVTFADKYESSIPEFKDEASTIKANDQYLTDLALDGVKIYTGGTYPSSVEDMYVLLPEDVVSLTRGSHTFTPTFPNGKTSHILSANLWLDKDGDGSFETHLGTTGTVNGNSNNLSTIIFTIPNDVTLGATRIRFRLDSSWDIAETADAKANRMVYDIPVVIIDDLPTTDITYNFILDGNNIGEQTISATIGAEFPVPTPTLKMSNDLLAFELPDGTVPEAGGTYDVNVSIAAADFPVPTTIANDKFAADTKWYYATLRGEYVKYNGTTLVTTSARGIGDDEFFAITGNIKDGFQLYNKALGTGKVIYSNQPKELDNKNPTPIELTAEPTGTWSVTTNSHGGFSFAVYYNSKNYYLHEKENVLSFWGSENATGDAGSSLVFSPVYEYSILVEGLPQGGTAGITFDGSAWNSDKMLAPDYIDLDRFSANDIAGYAWEYSLVERTITLTYSTVETTINPEAVVALVNRIGGEGTAEKFKFVLDPSINSKQETFVLGNEDGKILIKGSTLSAITTGLGWYLNNIAHINIAWNSLNEKTVSGAAYVDLTNIELPLPAEETHVSDAKYRYYLNYCTFGYSMTSWTWKRWQQEIDWMALHGINMPLQLVGLEEVWRTFLTMEDANGNRKYGYTDEEAKAFVAGPAFIAWWAMNNLEGWGGTAAGSKSSYNNLAGAGGVQDDAWYERQKKLAKQIVDAQRGLGMQPVIPGWSGMVPTNFAAKSTYATRYNGINWAGDFVRPLLLNTSIGADKYAEIAADYYECLHAVMGESQYYSMDPFHEGGGAGTMEDYTAMYEAMEKATPGSQWVIQQWQWTSTQRYSLTAVPEGRLVVLDLFADGSPAFDKYNGYAPQDAVFCTIPNFGGRSGLMGRLQNVTDNYFNFKAKYANIKGIGAAPEAIEQTPVTYDLIFQLPWMGAKPDVAQWVENYAVARYGKNNAVTKDVWNLLRQSVLAYGADGIEGPIEDVWAARPNLVAWYVSSWGSTLSQSQKGKDVGATYTPARRQMLIDAVYKLISQKDILNLKEGSIYESNYLYDIVEFAGGVMADYAHDLLLGIDTAKTAAGANFATDATYIARRDAFLQLIRDMDTFRGTNLNFRLGKWTQEARAAAAEVVNPTSATPDWYEYNNARTIVSTWSSPGTNLTDYSYRSWQGLLKDYYLPRWEYYFKEIEAGRTPTGDNYKFFEWNWAHGMTHKVGDNAISTTPLQKGEQGHTDSYTREPEGNTVEKAVEMLGKYIIPIKYKNGTTYYAYRTFNTDLTDKVTITVAAGATVDFTQYFDVPADAVVTGSVVNNNEQSANIKAVPVVAEGESLTGAITLTDGTVLSNFSVELAQFNGYYHIYFMDGENEVPTFISYNDENIYGNYGDSSDWGYKIVAKGVYVTDEDADGVFAIVPSGNGYTISAQGKYLKSPVFNDWKHIQFSDNEDDAGAYLFEKETGLDVFKIKADGAPIDNGEEWVVHNPYLQFYNHQSTGKLVLGNTNTQNSGSGFKLVSATSYTITIPESGFLPLCLPFNVELPEGVEACDIHELSREKLMMGSEGLFTTIATAGQIVKAGTPMILKGTASASYALGITLNNNGAKTSLAGSVLRGNYVKQTLAEGTKRFMLNGAGDAFEGHETSVDVPANSCWIEADIEDASIDLIQKPSYTVTLSSKGYLPLYLPLNVVLPDGVTAYDINDLSKERWLLGDAEGGLLKQIAGSGEILKARTAVILKGTAGATCELTKTLSEEGAKGSLEGSLLRGSLTTQAILPSDGVRKYVFSTTMGDMFDMLEANTQIPANSCWIEMAITADNEEHIYEDIDLIPNFITTTDGWQFRVKNTGKGITITDCMTSGTNSHLTIGSTYEVGGVTKKVVGVTDYFLDYNTYVTEVTLPATLTSVGTGYANPMFDITYQGADYGVGEGIGEPDGEGKVAEDAVAAEAAAWMGQSHIFPNRTKVYGASTWRMTVGVKIAEDAGSFNQWGSCLLATKEYTLANDYSDGSMQLYLRADRQRVVFKLDSDGDRDEFGLTHAEDYKADSLTFIFENDGAGGYKIKVKFEGGVTEEREIVARDHAELHDFNAVWSSLGEGITVNVKFEKLTTHGLFVGCKNLTAIHVADGNESFHGCEHGVLYNYNKNHVIRFPEGGGEDRNGDGRRNFEIPREVTRVYAGALHGVDADIIFHSNPSIMHVEGHEEHVTAKYYLRLEDDSASIDLAANLNTFQNIKYKREVRKTDANGKKMYYSVILPFKPAAEDLAPYEFYRFSRADEQGIDFSEVVADEVEANVPYLFAVRDSHSEVHPFETAITAGAEPHTLGWHNDTVAMKHGDWVVVGCYSNEVIDVVNGNNGKNANYYFYGVSSATNKLVRVTNSIKTKPYRMFFVNTRPVNSNGVALARQLNLRLINGSTTEITPEQIDGWGETEPIYYDLQGRRVLNPENGIYIVNGKKVVL